MVEVDMKITIKTIPHLQQRYNTCGDWKIDLNGDITILVSEMPKTGWKGPMLVAVHELVETLLCKDRGITQESVDAFDKSFGSPLDDEPGDDPMAPYHKEHNTATGIERILASEFNLAWKPYEDELNKMTEEYDAV